MSIDTLQEKIRKMKNPSMIDFGVKAEHIPPQLLEQETDLVCAYARFCRELMQGLKGIVPAVRFPFGMFALMGPSGLEALSALLREASDCGYYVVLDGPEILSPWGADRAAEGIFAENSRYPCDGLILSPYIGSDGIKPFLPYCKDQEKDIYMMIRSANKTASELQDLMTGSRLVHGAAADIVKRHGETILGRCGYSRVGAAASACAPDSLRSLRSKYDRLFLLVDGLDYPSGNAKNCSFAFDRFGHGAVVCCGPSVTAAWKEAGQADSYVSCAVQAAERMKKNLTRYISIL